MRKPARRKGKHACTYIMPFRSLDVLKLNKENFEKNYNPIYIFIGKKKT